MYRLYEEELKSIEPGISAKDIEVKRDAHFADWLKDKVSDFRKIVTVSLSKLNLMEYVSNPIVLLYVDSRQNAFSSTKYCSLGFGSE